MRVVYENDFAKIIEIEQSFYNIKDVIGDEYLSERELSEVKKRIEKNGVFGYKLVNHEGKVINNLVSWGNIGRYNKHSNFHYESLKPLFYTLHMYDEFKL